MYIDFEKNFCQGTLQISDIVQYKQSKIICSFLRTLLFQQKTLNPTKQVTKNDLRYRERHVCIMSSSVLLSHFFLSFFYTLPIFLSLSAYASRFCVPETFFGYYCLAPNYFILSTFYFCPFRPDWRKPISEILIHFFRITRKLY